jgi:8-oxo-dGTP pyrophosphatase MutT (NUDIX family)
MYPHEHNRTGHGAGILLARPQGRVLLLRRSQQINNPGRWNLPGGGVDPGEDPYDAAFREFAEEAGSIPPGRIESVYTLHKTRKGRDRTYTTVAVRLGDPNWQPHINWESDALCWITPRAALYAHEAGELRLHHLTRDILRWWRDASE